MHLLYWYLKTNINNLNILNDSDKMRSMLKVTTCDIVNAAKQIILQWSMMWFRQMAQLSTTMSIAKHIRHILLKPVVTNTKFNYRMYVMQSDCSRFKTQSPVFKDCPELSPGELSH